ncbi:MAG: hypothetical protein COC19_00815 [SAR86 cluster bacterium]|uniref:YchJ-like middle NTF2-like domain-containing protein n=1 Tax=SAR86 cluster bacterium TaxID=2030880 RepID=A0A2A4MUT9_9GAMM|nr:MAG: hypothetical protein COC19_00815 [SAR86 cluster bacterium]
MPSSPCPCTSGKSYTRCCGPLHNRSAVAKTPKQLMRSRYSAYALGGHGDYLLESWHPDSRPRVNAESLSAKTLNWQALKILHTSQSGNDAVVEFEARFTEVDGSAGRHHEVSRFIRLHGKWLYVNAE